MTKPATTEADVLLISGIAGDLAKEQTFRPCTAWSAAELQRPTVRVAA